MIKREDIEAQIASLTTQCEQVLANYHMSNGALQNAKFWLAEFDKPEPEEAPKPEAE